MEQMIDSIAVSRDSWKLNRLLLDCTDLVYFGFSTGIQRVQRNLITHLIAVSDAFDVQCEPVAYVGGRCFRKLQVPAFGTELALGYFDTVYLASQQPWRFRKLVESVFPFRRFKAMMDRSWHGPARLLLIAPLMLLIIPFLFLALVHSRLVPAHRSWVPSREDVLLVTGASWWTFEFKSALQYVKNRGGKIAAIVYDLIPITHPSFWNQDHTTKFSNRFNYLCAIADMLVADSFYTQCVIDEYISEKPITSQPLTSHFKLGMDLDMAKPDGPVRPEIQQLFAGNLKSYLSVGTIEPRKNFAFLLEAFDEIWQAFPHAVLCIVGGYGWHMEKFVSHLLNHPQYGKSLFWFKDLTDTELAFCYSHARALVYPSIVEGYGLPLVEALRYGCPVLASDIPVFHEVGGDLCTYFSLGSKQDLVQLIRKIELDPQTEILKIPKSFKAITWEESAAQLLSLIKEHLYEAEH